MSSQLTTCTWVRRPIVTMFSSSPVSCMREPAPVPEPPRGAAATGFWRGRVPRPGARSISPSDDSCSSALRTVTRATPN